MKRFFILTKRNIKLFFKDKGMFFVALITPAILLVLYATFLGNIYKESFMLSIPSGMEIEERLINACVGGQLISSILAVSCVTVAFCSNMLMVQDKANGTIKDFTIAPISQGTLSVSYYISTLISTLTVCLAATGICLVYIAITGFYMSIADILLLLLDVFLLAMFGVALSSVVNFFLSSQGQISAVGTIVSSGYGFISGAYMPISQFSEGIRNAIAFFPGTYGTALLRSHAMRGVFSELERSGLPEKPIEEMAKAIDCDIYFFGTPVPSGINYVILTASIVILLGIYILMSIYRSKKGKVK